MTCDGITQYHLIFSSIGQDPFLHRSTEKKIYDSFKPNSKECNYYLKESIKIYAAKLAGKILEDTFLKYMPWELVFSSKPPADQLSSNGDALYALLNTVSVQKFVCVYDAAKDDWICCLSTNKVSCSLTLSAALCINGQAVNQSKDFGPIWIEGDWENAAKDANAAYSKGIKAETYICEVQVVSTSKDSVELVNEIYAPNYIAHMAF